MGGKGSRSQVPYARSMPDESSLVEFRHLGEVLNRDKTEVIWMLFDE